MIAVGILAFAIGSLAIVIGGACVAARAFAPPRPVADRLVATALFALAACVAMVRALAPLGLLIPGAVVATSLVVAFSAATLAGRPARRQVQRDVERAARIAASSFTGGTSALAAWVGAVALAIAAFAAWLLPEWSYDALGHHLPIVDDALQTHTLRWVPTHIPYINVYPRAVECFFIWCRLHLQHDALLDLCQAPFGITAAVAVGAMARRGGVVATRAVALGALFLAVPLVALQMATSYVDVAYASLLLVSAYFATGPLERRDVWAWALATAFLLASKPCAPPAVAILATVVGVRARHRGVLAHALGATVLVALLGGDRYVANLVEHGNPIWPVAIAIGPLSLPGLDDAANLYMHGLPEPYAHYGWVRRVLASIFVEPGEYIYDMRMGGFGPLVAWGLVPLAMVGLVSLIRAGRARLAAPMLLVMVCAVATPAAAWLRFALALPAALLALVGIASEGWGRTRRALDLGLAALAVAGMWRALPGFTGGRASLLAVASMPRAARAVAVGVDGHEVEWVDARARVAPEESIAYDRSFSLPGLLWRADGRSRLVFLDEVDALATSLRLDAERVRILVAGEGAAEEAVARDRDRFRLLSRCPLDPCTVYEVRPPGGAERLGL